MTAGSVEAWSETEAPSASASLARLGQDDYPSLYNLADRAAVIGQRSHVRLVKWELVLIVGADGVGGIAPIFIRGIEQIVFAIAAAMLLGSILVRSANRMQNLDSDWFEGRAAAEMIKSMVWRYMMRLAPFDGADREADNSFLHQLREVLQDRPAVAHSGIRGASFSAQITPRMRQVRSGTLDERRQMYMADRVGDQIDWYTRKAALHRRHATLWFWAGVMAQALAMGWAIFRVVRPASVDLLSFFADTAVAVTAWVQLQKYDDLSKAYSMAAQELMILDALLEEAPDEERFGQLVEDSEGAISREHNSWISNR